MTTAANTTYTMIDDGAFTVYVGNNVYYVEGNDVEPDVVCPTAGMIYEDFYCSKYIY